MTTAVNTECIHRTRQCENIAPGVSVCGCGQVFLFVSSGNVGRYKKMEEVTEQDAANFSPEMEAEFLRFMGKK